MDIKIENGDLALGKNGLLKTVEGLEETLQRVWLCLSVPKGAFVYDRALGGRLLGETSPRRLKALAEEAVLGRCAAEITECRVEGRQAVFTVLTGAGTGEVRIGLEEPVKEESSENL